MNREHWFYLMDGIDAVLVEEDIVRSKNMLANLIREVLIELRPPNAAEKKAFERGYSAGREDEAWQAYKEPKE